MNQGRIVVITGLPRTGKSTIASIIAKEFDKEKSAHMHTDDFYHFLSKGAISPYLPESNEQNLVVIEAFFRASKEETLKRAVERSKLDRKVNIELVEMMWEQFCSLGIYESYVVDTTIHSIQDTVSVVKGIIKTKKALLSYERESS